MKSVTNSSQVCILVENTFYGGVCSYFVEIYAGIVNKSQVKNIEAFTLNCKHNYVFLSLNMDLFDLILKLGVNSKSKTTSWRIY